MPAKRYKVTLSAEERAELTQLVNKGKAAARKLAHARILLLADEGEAGSGWKDDQIVDALSISRSTVERVRQAWVMHGPEAALNHKRPYQTRPRLLDGEAEAHLVRLACSAPPEGRERWTMQLLADKLVALGIVERVSDETVRQTLKKTTSNRG